MSGGDHGQEEAKLQPSRRDIYGDGWARAALGSMGGDPVVSGDQLDLDRLDDWARGIIDLTSDEARAVVAEVRRLRAWKAEALPVMAGLQELGGALGLPLGSRITGREAVDAALDLHNEARRAR